MILERKNRLFTCSSGARCAAAFSFTLCLLLLSISTAVAGGAGEVADEPTAVRLPNAFEAEYPQEWRDEFMEHLLDYLRARAIPQRTAERVLSAVRPATLPDDVNAAFERVAAIIEDTERALRRGIPPGEAIAIARTRNRRPVQITTDPAARRTRPTNPAEDRARERVEQSEAQRRAERRGVPEGADAPFF